MANAKKNEDDEDSSSLEAKINLSNC